MDYSLQGYAEKACIFWGGYIEQPKLIKHRENAVFDVTLRGNVRVALRLHRPGYKKQEEIESELWWTNALAEKGFPVPVPVQNVDGNSLLPVHILEVLATNIVWIKPEDFLLGYLTVLDECLMCYPFENYITMWSSSFDIWVMNSLIVAVCATFFTTIFCSMAGYAFARIDFFGRKFIYPLVLAGLMIPGELLFIPLFTQFSSLGLNNTHTGLFLPKLGIPFGVFIMTQYFKGVPKEVEEASVVDGANRLQIFFKIMLPLAVPALFTVAIVNFGGAWNDYVWPLVSASETHMRTLQVGMSLQLGNRLSMYMGTSLAGIIISTIPTIFLLVYFQKYLLLSLIHI